ncbi:MAG TPA: arginine--tRNA ligase [Opitutaceae bacterium]|nr:arginine--tRNA ligase [Opitutaceae bacterium]
MPFSLNIANDLDAALRAAGASAGLDPATFAPEVRTADLAHGDFQANGALAYAKRQKSNPRALAETLAGLLPADLKEQVEVSIAGPGFINLSLRPGALASWLNAFLAEPALQQAAAQRLAGRRYVVDYSAPNTAKQMHVGHLRSAVIGESLCRLLAFNGAAVIRDNHIGDWGTQFGKLIYAYKRWADPAALDKDPIEELERLYKLGNAATPDGSPELAEARQELVRLQAHEPASLALWRMFSDISLKAYQPIYDRLGIRFDHCLGESFYNDKLEPVFAELTRTGIAQPSEGALVVFHPEHPRFKTQPLIIRKSDGAANYASTDLATILYRVEHFRADAVLYVVDKRQSDHFEQLFLTARKWFERTGRPLPELDHVDFGTVLDENGRPLKTRSGENVRLKDLLDEAEERAYALVSDKSPDLPEAERRAIAGIVGVGSVQYADLCQNRSTDYIFSWDKMISLEGNTAAYLLYAVARIHSIVRRAGGATAAPAPAAAPQSAGELRLARRLIRFPDALRLATDTLRPHHLALYLYELAGEFSAFYTTDKVLADEPEVRARRLALCRQTALILETGLKLLGLRTLDRM